MKWKNLKLYNIIFKESIIGTLMVLSVLLVQLQRHSLTNNVVIDNNNTDWKVSIVSDQKDGGASYAKISRFRTGWVVKYHLVEKAESPIVSFNIERSDSSLVDLTEYDGIKIDVRSLGVTDRFRLQIKSVEPGITTEDDSHSLKINEVYVDEESLLPDLSINWNDFRVPTWWGSKYNLNFYQTRVNVSKVKYIQISTSENIKEGEGDFVINSITLHGKYLKSLGLYRFLTIFWLAFAFLMVFASYYKQRDENNKLVDEKNEIKEKLNVDPLTGCLNRRGFYDYKNSLECKSSNSRPTCLIYGDIDFFKRINDEQGHAKGDEILKGYAEILMNSVRGRDIVCRWGGEEFVILLQNCGYTIGMEIAERIRYKVAQSELGITSSFGLVNYKKYPDYNNMLEQGDKALYEAKESGRNQVVGVKLT